MIIFLFALPVSNKAWVKKHLQHHV